MSLFFRKHWPIIGLLILAVAGQLFLISRSTSFLVANLLPDDAFYYFQVAKNVVAGHGSSFDGVNLTNGYHPLWMVINIAVFGWFAHGAVDPIVPIRCLLFIAVLFNVITAGLIFLILRKLTDQIWLQVGGLFLWLFNPFVIAESLNGLETSVSLMFIVLLAYLISNGQPVNNRRVGIMGLVAGLMIVARMDNIFYFFAVLIWLVLTSGLVKNFKKVFIFGATAFLMVSPWLVWNYATFGMISTSAANTASLVTHGLVRQDNPASLWLWPKTVLYMTDLKLAQVVSQTGAPTLILVLLGLALGLVAFNFNKIKSSDSLNRFPLLFLFGGWVGLFLANASLRWVGRSWYFIAINFFIIVFIVWALDQAKDRLVFSRSIILAVLLLAAFSFGLGWKREVLGSQATQLTMLKTAAWTNQHLPVGAVIGAFNSGVQGYFSNHRVVNLDGLINNNAARAIADRQLGPYIVNNIDYLSDFPIYLNYRYKSFMGVDDFALNLDVVSKVSVGAKLYGDDQGIVVYRIKKP